MVAGRGNSGGSWLPEEKKANMWPGRRNSGGSWLPEEKKANMWRGRGNSGGSWPPAFPRPPAIVLYNLFGYYGNKNF